MERHDGYDLPASWIRETVESGRICSSLRSADWATVFKAICSSNPFSSVAALRAAKEHHARAALGAGLEQANDVDRDVGGRRLRTMLLAASGCPLDELARLLPDTFDTLSNDLIDELAATSSPTELGTTLATFLGSASEVGSHRVVSWLQINGHASMIVPQSPELVLALSGRLDQPLGTDIASLLLHAPNPSIRHETVERILATLRHVLVHGEDDLEEDYVAEWLLALRPLAQELASSVDLFAGLLHSHAHSFSVSVAAIDLLVGVRASRVLDEFAHAAGPDALGTKCIARIAGAVLSDNYADAMRLTGRLLHEHPLGWVGFRTLLPWLETWLPTRPGLATELVRWALAMDASVDGDPRIQLLGTVAAAGASDEQVWQQLASQKQTPDMLALRWITNDPRVETVPALQAIFDGWFAEKVSRARLRSACDFRAMAVTSLQSNDPVRAGAAAELLARAHVFDWQIAEAASLPAYDADGPFGQQYPARLLARELERRLAA